MLLDTRNEVDELDEEANALEVALAALPEVDLRTSLALGIENARANALRDELVYSGRG